MEKTKRYSKTLFLAGRTYGYQSLSRKPNHLRLEFLMYEKMACILYVLPSSPAARAGLKRGEWISAINGSPLTPANASTLYNGGDIQLTIYREKPGNQYVFSRTVEVKAACRVKDNPVFLDTVYSIKTDRLLIWYITILLPVPTAHTTKPTTTHYVGYLPDLQPNKSAN